MTKMLKTCIGVGALLLAALTAPAQAYQCESDFCGSNGCMTGCGVSSLYFAGGHADFGLYGNNHGQRNVYDLRDAPGEKWNPNSGNTIALGPARHADLQMNQLYGFFGKKLNKRGWDIGGRMDFLYGTDAYFTQSNGLEYFTSPNNSPAADRDRWGKGDYLASFPQAYGEIGYCNLSVKLGKFYTPLNGDAIMSPNRFFYSTSYAFGQLPMTQTGAVATWDINPCLSAYGGWTNGEEPAGPLSDSTFANAKNNAALFGFDYKVRKFSLGYGILMGKGENNVGNHDFDYFAHSFVIGYKPNRCWDYTFQWVLRNNNDDWGAGADATAAYGINQELIYKLNRCWAFGGRFEWMRMQDADFYEFTLGTNYTPNNWLVVRPEIRWDHSNEEYFAMGDSKNQFGFGVSTILKF